MSTAHLRNIAIAGASGVIGKPIIKALLEGGKHNITAFTRLGSRPTLPEDVRVVYVDYGDEAALVEALKGQDVLLNCLSVATPPDTEKRLIDAAAKAGVQWLVPKEWSPDITSDPQVRKDLIFSESFLEMRQYIESKGMFWTAQCSSFWYEHSLVSPQCFGFELDKKRVTFFDDGTLRVTATTWEQCARAIASLFSLPPQSDDGPCLMQWKNRQHYCSSFFVSQRDVLESWLRVTGQKESDWMIEHESTKDRFERGQKMLQEGDMMGGPITNYARLFYPDGSGDLRSKSENQQLSLPGEDLDEATTRVMELFEEGYSYDPFR